MKKLVLVIVSYILIFASCTKTTSDGAGKLVVKVTDDPFNISFVESATVTINKVELRKAGSDETDGNVFIVLSEEPVTFDLLKLRNGVTAKMLDLDIPAGEYDLIRLYVTEAGLRIKDQATDFRLKIPGGAQSGIKVFIEPALKVEGGLTSEVLIDFDLSKSFVLQGNLNHGSGIKGFHFKPVVRATNNTVAGRIEGMVTDELSAAIENARVWLKKDTTGISTSFTDATGKYAMIGIPAGSYTLYAWKSDYDTVRFEDVVVVEGNRTIRNVTLTR